MGLCGLLLVGAGCPSMPDISPPVEVPVPISVSTTLNWKTQGPGFDRAETVFSSTTGATLVLYRLSPEQHDAELLHTLPPKHLSVWGAEATTGTTLLVNGVYFHEDYLPSGFVRRQGERIGTRLFDQDKSGAIVFHPLRLVDTKTVPLKLDVQKDVAQSYPFLMRNGVSAVAEESGKMARRTFLGTDREGMTYVGVVPYAPITLYQLGRFLEDLPISWAHVLNLDGGPSTGLWMRSGRESELLDSYVPVPNILRFHRIAPLPGR